MLANLPLTLPSSVSFQRYHLRHHAFQGRVAGRLSRAARHSRAAA
jgi:hypothetical protein